MPDRPPDSTRTSLLAALVDCANDALFAADVRGAILTWNPAAEQFLGYPPADVIGRPIHLLCSPTRHAELRAALARVQGGAPEERLATEGWHRDGHALPLILTLTAVRQGAVPTGAVAIRLCPDPGAGDRPPRVMDQDEARLRTLTLAIEQSPAAVIISDIQGRIEYVNRRFTEMTGYSVEEAIGQTPRLLKSGLTPRETYEHLWETILTGAVWRGELSNRRKNGELYWHATSISPVRDAQGRVFRFVAIQEDVTRQRGMIEALQASEASLRQTVETATEGIWRVDAEHRTVFVNARLAEMLGDTEAEMLGRSVFDFTDPEGRAIAEASLARRKQGIREQLDFKLRRRDGSALWVLMSTGPIFEADHRYAGALAMVTDMTSRREAQAALTQSEAYFRALIEEAHDLIAVLDADGVFRYASPSHLHILGHPPAELLGASAFGFIHPEDLDSVTRVFEEATAEPGAVRLQQFRFRHRDGSWRVLEGIGRNLLEDTIVRGVVINGRDVTERVALEAQFRQSQKMEAVGRFAGGVVHDLNNVLSAILGFGTLLQDDLPADHPGQEDLAEIRNAAERAAGLNRQLLAFTRQQVLQPCLVDLNRLVAGLQGMVARLLREDIILETRLADEPATVRADPIQLEQIILNLAVNSRDAMPNGGRLLIETARVVLGEPYVVDHAPVLPGSYVMIAMSDTGVGMNESTRVHAFEPFFTTKGEGKGTGLGLSTVYGIVKQSGGFIWLYSELGRGTIVKIYLPQAEGVATATQQIAEPATLRGTETVLLVDDNAPMRLFARRALERQGYTVLDATAVTALELARHHAGLIHLLLTDVVMPELSGPQLASRLQEIRPALRVLYISGFAGNSALLDGVVGTERGFLQKPFTTTRLAEKVREVLDQVAH